jgi:hypothetical protein
VHGTAKKSTHGSADECNALFIQLISDDIREAGLDEDFLKEFDWNEYEERQEAGYIAELTARYVTISADKNRVAAAQSKQDTISLLSNNLEMPDVCQTTKFDNMHQSLAGHIMILQIAVLQQHVRSCAVSAVYLD